MNKQEAIELLICEKVCVEDVDGNIGGERVRQAYDMAIEALQDDWIPVSERLPEEMEEVLVCVTHNGKSKMAVSCRRDYNYWDGLGRDIIGEIAWMPLPEPYKGGDTE